MQRTFVSAFLKICDILSCVDGSHVVQDPLAVLVNVVELHVVDIVLPGRLDDSVVLPVAPPARHVALHVDLEAIV